MTDPVYVTANVSLADASEPETQRAIGEIMGQAILDAGLKTFALLPSPAVGRSCGLKTFALLPSPAVGRSCRVTLANGLIVRGILYEHEGEPWVRFDVAGWR